MTKTQQPPVNRLSLEPLEERWLFSVGWPKLEPLFSIEPVVAAQIFNPPVVDAESDLESLSSLDELENDIAPSSLPPSIQQTVSEALAGWQAVGAVIQTDKNVTNYVARAERSGAIVEFKIGLDGDLQEAEQEVQVAELPNSIQNWARSNFPGAKVREVVRVSDVSGVGYDITFAMPNGQELEATYQEIDASSPLPVQATSSDLLGQWKVAETDPQLLVREYGLGSNDSERSVIENSTASRYAPTRATEAEASHDEVATVERIRTDNSVTNERDREASFFAEHSSWVTEVVGPAVGIVGAIRDWVPIDVEAVERGVNQFLKSLNQLGLTETGDWRVGVYPILPAISIMIGVQTYASQSLRRKRPDLTKLDER